MPVSVKEFLGDLSPFVLEEKRTFSDEYVEVVGRQAEWLLWSAKLSGLVGPAKKKAGEKPSAEMEKLSAPWGGIQRNQTLFHGEGLLAMVWPWNDGMRFTLKVVRLPAA